VNRETGLPGARPDAAVEDESSIDADVLRRFAAIHLQGPVERAVFELLSRSSSGHWTAAEIATELGADERLVDVVVRQFAAARILEVTRRGSRTSRYRVRPISSFLADEAAGALVDPVCGMKVDENTPFAIRHDVTPVRFCSQRCQLIWERAHSDVR
jgi:YHS domain-containing protein